MTVDQPVLSDQRVRLRPPRPADYPFLYELAVATSESFRWRYRAVQPSFEDFVRDFRQGVLVNFMVEKKAPAGERSGYVGYVVCYQADFRNRHAHVAVQGTPGARPGVMAEAGRIFIRYLFQTYDFEKLYAESIEFSYESFKGGALGGGFVEEGCLKDHERFLGHSWDLHLLAIYRSTWEARDKDRQQSAAANEVGRGEMGGSGLSLEAFLDELNTAFDLGVQISAQSRLVDDLGLDSVGHHELIDTIESLGCTIPDDALSGVRTIEDLYFQYLQYPSVR